nr:hypothetical protein [Tanacetum cinerariifolium]
MKPQNLLANGRIEDCQGKFCNWVNVLKFGVVQARDSRPDVSFDIPASSECMSGLARATSTEVIRYVSPSEFWAMWLVHAHVLLCDVVGLGVTCVMGCVRLQLPKRRHSKMTQINLNDLIIRYNILHDLHPRLPFPKLVMSELPDEVIEVYHRMFDFSSVRIPFSTFLLSIIKYYKVYFSQLGPLGLNKVVTFEVLYRSLQIDSTVTLFSIFQTLCKQGHWFSFVKRRDPSPICIDDNISCMKSWKSGLFLIDQRVVPVYMSWRHPSSAIDDPKPPAGSYSQYDVRRLSAHVVKLRNIPEGVLVLSGLSQVWKSQTRDPIIKDSSGNVIEGTRAKVMFLPLLKVLAPEAIMTDAFDASSEGAGRSRSSVGPAPSFQDISSDAIHMNFFLFSPGPYYATYPEYEVATSCEFSREEWDAPYQPTLTVLTKEVFKDLVVCKTVADQFPTLGEMVWIEALTNDQLTAKMSELLSLAASAGFERGLSVDRTQEEFARVYDCASHPLSAILQLEPEKLARSDDVSAPKDTYVSPLVAKESTVTHVSSYLELPSNDVPFSSTAALGKNKEWGVSHTVGKDDGSSLAQGPKRVSFSPNDVAVTLSVGEKYNGSSSLSFPVTAEEAIAAPSELLWSSPGCFGPNMSFNMPDSPECLSGLAHASVVEVFKLQFFFGSFEGDYTSSCPPNVAILQSYAFFLTCAILPLSAATYFAPDSFLPCLVCIDHNRSCMMHWKSDFFLIDRRAIPDYMTLRHPKSAIDDPKLVVGSYRMADVRRLSAHVVKLRSMPEVVLVLSGLSCVWKSRTCNPVLRSADGNVMGIHDFLCAGAKDLARNPSAKVIAKAEASQKPKASISGAASGHVTKRTKSTLAQSSRSTTRPNLFADDFGVEINDDDDACYEIPIVTPIRKGIMTDADVAVAPSVGAIRPRVSSGPAPSFRYLFRDAVHRYFFPFSPGPYYATYLEGGMTGNCEFTREECDAPHEPTLTVLTKEVFNDPSICKIMVDQFPTPREMSYREYVQSTNSRLKGYQEKFASLTGLESQVSGLQRQVSGLNDKLSASDAAFARSKAKGNERKKNIKSFTKSLDNLHAEVARLSAYLNWATILEADRDKEILRLKATPIVQAELLSLVASVGTKRGLSMHQTKEDFAIVLKKISQFVHGLQDRLAATSPYSSGQRPRFKGCLYFSSYCKGVNCDTYFHILGVALQYRSYFFHRYFGANEEWVNAMVDGSDDEITDGAANAKPGSMFVQGASYVVDDATKLTVAGSERVPSGPSDVVVALSTRDKGDGFVPSSVVDEEVAATPSRFRSCTSRSRYRSISKQTIR